MSCRFESVHPASAFPPASDKRRSVDVDVCASIADTFYTGIMLLDMAFAHTPSLFQEVSPELISILPGVGHRMSQFHLQFIAPPFMDLYPFRTDTALPFFIGQGVKALNKFRSPDMLSKIARNPGLFRTWVRTENCPLF
jgi:hypothetical protein